MIRAVVFDLWETVVDWSPERSADYDRRFADRIGVTVDDYRSVRRSPDLWLQAESGPLGPMFAELGARLGVVVDVEEAVGFRNEYARESLHPRDGVVETLTELRARGLGVGLISNCTSDVPEIWPETAFAPLFDVAVFSSACGLVKPDPRIYALVLDGLGVEPREALFVGDGANDELGGAERVGMRPVLIHRPGEDPHWDGLREWDGDRITSIPGVLDLL